MPIKSIKHRRRFVTVRGAYGEALDVEMPGDRPLGALLPDLLKTLGWPESDGERPLRYRFQTEAGALLALGDSLLDAGVENSDALWLVPDDGQSGDAEPSRPRPPAGPAPEPDARLVLPDPSLLSQDGLIFVLPPPPVRIGRPDKAGRPDIDLTDLEARLERPVSSRRHAEIVAQDGRYALLALPATNGTFVNGVELPAGEARPLRDGDVLQFGFGGVALTFFGAGTAVPASFFA